MALSWAGGSGPWPGEACWGLLAVPWSGGWLEADGVAEGFELGDKPAVSRSGSRRLVTAMSTNTDSKCVMFTDVGRHLNRRVVLCVIVGNGGRVVWHSHVRE